MAIDLVYYGHETLRKIAEEVSNIDGELIDFIDSMFNVMYRAKGLGLAAPQVDRSRRVVTLDIDDNKKNIVMELINPVIREFSKKEEPYEEGCLSVPGIMGEVVRPVEISVSALNRDGKEIEFEAGGLLARVIQHEVDHLNGILFVDHLEDYRRNELRSELKKIKKLNKRP
ncbi:MAG TPA: peptide deformylase [Spirochaetota bacterium]|nr:peptide deformylase [Spirochaetota bacterium]HPC40693.1 peptide deformylase [Spirochaetota bacterium]HPL17867.1 peptide deformylase [Spirochaetota bacterium]HQF09399.1 peptide deformylase [Spirochaetota bacterium]HQH97987.1 peptide deformylase [Spirochaetota bacterium]